MRKILRISSVLAILAGIMLVVGGIWGIYFTYKNVSAEKIVTPSDATIPDKSVRGPLTLKAQADIIRQHTLRTTGGETFAEMPRQVQSLDENGQSILDKDGEPIMVPNEARDIWITSTALVTALHLGVLTYVFSGLMVLLGLISIWTGIVFFMLNRKMI
jgi:hypothetical protein